MIHLTLNTGHSMDVPPIKLAKEAIAATAPLRHGGSLALVAPSLGAFSVEVKAGPGDGASAFTLFHRGNPVTLNVVAWKQEDARAAWAAVEGVYLDMSDHHSQLMAAQAAPEMPATVPWLATMILPGIATMSREDMEWVGDFEQCMAAAIMAYGN